MISVAVIGASGYSGAELLRLLARRDDVAIASAMAGKHAGQRIDALYPDLTGILDRTFDAVDEVGAAGADIAFLALPSGESMNLVPALRGRVGRIIDLSGDFRLTDPLLYRQFYGHDHAAANLLGSAVYGLPELNRDAIAAARLVANPGCYSTAALLGLLPALQGRLIDPRHIVVNALSGASGAGRSAAIELSFTEVNENVRAYKVATHQHIPEIQSVLERATGTTVRLSFIPHLVPISRGIYTTITADLDRSLSQQEALALYTEYYRASPFVRVRQGIPEIRSVVHTNYCDIGLVVETRTNRLIIMTVLDNMVKGAAGQAVQNMNLMVGLPEACALT
jgi:N-acetyl-gamma-glutamyl-phosphate reductase